HQLRGLVQEDAPGDTGTRWSLLRKLWRWAIGDCGFSRKKANNPVHPSLRRESGEQPSGEPDIAVPAVPYPAPQKDAVAVVRRIGCGPIKVYDIQVEATQCFFAAEILVHNCVVLDDPHASREDAESPRMREKTWEEYQDNLSKRLVPGGCIIGVLTRWHEQDWAGMILPDSWNGESGV